MVKGGCSSTSSTGKKRNTVADIILVENTNKVRKVNTKPMPNTIKVRPSSIRSDVGTVAAPVIFIACGDLIYAAMVRLALFQCVNLPTCDQSRKNTQYKNY